MQSQPLDSSTGDRSASAAPARRSAAIAARRAARSHALLGLLGLASFGLVLLRLVETWRVSPQRVSHQRRDIRANAQLSRREHGRRDRSHPGGARCGRDGEGPARCGQRGDGRPKAPSTAGASHPSGSGWRTRDRRRAPSRILRWAAQSPRLRDERRAGDPGRFGAGGGLGARTPPRAPPRSLAARHEPCAHPGDVLPAGTR